MKEVKLTRQELYDLVWSESMLSLAKTYAISDVGLRKKCRSLEIPIPNAGYWAKVKFGKKVAQRRALGEFKGEQAVLLRLREEGNEKEISHVVVKKSIEEDTRINLVVPEKLKNPDKMIVDVKEYYSSKEIIQSSSNILDMRVSTKMLDRALRFMDTFIKALRGRGHDIVVKFGGTFILIYGQEFNVFCSNRLIKEENLASVSIKENENNNNSILCITVKISFNFRDWKDGKRPLEEQLSSILASLEIKGKKEKEEQIEREERWEEEKSNERKQKAIQDRKEKELNAFKELFKKAKRHDKAEMIRKYASKLEENAVSRNELSEEIKEEIEWARKKADWYDPFIEGKDKLLDGIDREELKLEKKSFYWLKDG